MDKENCLRKPQELRRNKVISLRITPHLSQWLRKENLSPTAIFYQAVKEIGYAEESK